MRARPAAVMATSTKRRSVGSAVRSTRPSASSLATTFVADGRCDLLDLGQRAERERTLVIDDGQRRQLARRQTGVGLLPQAAGQAGGGEAEPAGQLGHGDLRRNLSRGLRRRP